MKYSNSEDNRIGDHVWWISNLSKFQSHYPDWKYKFGIMDIMEQILESMAGRA